MALILQITETMSELKERISARLKKHAGVETEPRVL